MTKETPPDKKLDEQTIREAAEAALRDLQVDAGVESVTTGGDGWRVHFTADYGQFSDSFRNHFGKENSFELVREKIKRHILHQQQRKIRAGARIRRGKPERRPPAENLFEAAVKTISGVASQTAGFAGEIINQAMSLPQTALTAMETAGQTLAEAINPAAEPASQPATPAAPPPQPLARVRIKMDAAEHIAKAPAKSSSVARRAPSKKASASKKAATKSSKRPTTKPAAKLAAKSASKPATKSASKLAAKSAKAASKSAAKKLHTKKSRAKKSSRKR